MGEFIDRALLNQLFVKALAAIIVAIVLEVVGLILMKVLERGLRASLSCHEGRNMQWRIVRRRRLVGLPRLLIRGSLMLLAIFIALQIFDLPIMPFAAWLAITSLSIVLTFRRMIENALACYMLMLEDAIGVGDKVRMGNCWVTVESVGWFATRMRDEDGLMHTVMNAYLMQLIRAPDDRERGAD